MLRTGKDKDNGGAGGGSSVDKVTLSIEQLTSSLQQLQSEAAALEVDTVPAAKRRKRRKCQTSWLLLVLPRLLARLVSRDQRVR